MLSVCEQVLALPIYQVYGILGRLHQRAVLLLALLKRLLCLLVLCDVPDNI